jgi:triacylglycerol lipase
MSFLTTLPKDRYDPQAFAGFDPSLTDFSLKNAYAFAWACQLAYETADPSKIASIAGLWNIELFPDSIISVESATVLPRSSTHLFIGRCRGAIIIAFAGTDPVSLANWISDFDLGITRSGAANGFAEAAQSVWPRIEELLRTRGDAGPIFVTGHSLGAALAAITASNIEAACIRHASHRQSAVRIDLQSSFGRTDLPSGAWPRPCPHRSAVQVE